MSHSNRVALILVVALLAAACPDAGTDEKAGSTTSQGGTEPRGTRLEVEYYDGAKTKKKAEGKTDYGRKVGPWTYWHENGSVMKQGEFVDGLERGLFASYWPSEDPTQVGPKAEESGFENGVQHGPCRAWWPSGQVRLEGEYDKGKKVGRWVEYYQNGQVAGDAKWIDNGIDGTLKTFYEDGSVRDECPYVKGNREGTEVRYYPTGEKEQEMTYAGGKRTGEWNAWHANGVKRAHGQYVDDLPSGLWETWHPNGKPWSIENFLAGKQQGESKEWHENGAPKTIRRYADGVLDGLQQEWYDDGTLKSEQEMTAGKPEYVWRGYHLGGSRMEQGSVLMQQEQGTTRARRIGTWYYWSAEGVLDMERSGNYDADQRVSPLNPEQVSAAPEPQTAGK